PLRSGMTGEAPGDLPAVQPRQAEVQQHHVGPVGLGRLDGGLAVRGDLDLVADPPQEAGQTRGTVGVVLDHKDTQPTRLGMVVTGLAVPPSAAGAVIIGWASSQRSGSGAATGA